MPVGSYDPADGDGVGVEGDTDSGSVIDWWRALLKGGLTGLFAGLGESIVNDGLWVPPSQKERGHLDATSVEVSIAGAESS